MPSADWELRKLAFSSQAKNEFFRRMGEAEPRVKNERLVNLSFTHLNIPAPKIGPSQRTGCRPIWCWMLRLTSL